LRQARAERLKRIDPIDAGRHTQRALTDQFTRTRLRERAEAQQREQPRKGPPHES
jgi:hypothetical protein